MEQLIKETTLPNGLTIRLFNCTRHYYGDFQLVKLDIRCTVQIVAEYFSNPVDYEMARTTLGETSQYHRSVERMGIPSASVGKILEELIINFEKHSLPYLVSPEFPRKLIMNEVHMVKRKSKIMLPLHG